MKDPTLSLGFLQYDVAETTKARARDIFLNNYTSMPLVEFTDLPFIFG